MQMTVCCVADDVVQELEEMLPLAELGLQLAEQVPDRSHETTLPPPEPHETQSETRELETPREGRK